MSSELPAKRKRNASSTSKVPVPDSDHRKKRRNRTTLSCMNCHTSKRMCDRKRPACARCIQLGMSGICIYEVDDPTQSSNSSDETTRLLRRVAELESVVRETTPSPSLTTPTEEHAHFPQPLPHIADQLHTIPPHHSQGYDYDYGYGSLTLPPLTVSPISLAYFGGVPRARDHDVGYGYGNYAPELPKPQESRVDEHDHEPGGHCNCLHDSANYTTILELSKQLRKTADLLTRSEAHGPLVRLGSTSSCVLSQRMSELDEFIRNVLGSAIRAPPSPADMPVAIKEESSSSSFEIEGSSESPPRWPVSTPEAAFTV
ncbi:hypothetical protein FPV67DRAFT_1692048 [Lyophyllum atratum]|nr:hypothetical protein FPV67DRAFT_1692048 [Lyophyllum atratum]